MLKIPVLVSNVTHLTDARYFSACGVDFISFPIEAHVENAVDVATLTEIAQWLEGPQILASITGIVDVPELINQYQEAVEGYVLGVYSPKQNVQPEGKIIIQEILLDASGFDQNQLQSIVDTNAYIVVKTSLSYTEASNFIDKEELNPKTTFIDTNIKTSELDEAQYGIVLRGSDEEKVGYKSYDELDEILEKLSED